MIGLNHFTAVIVTSTLAPFTYQLSTRKWLLVAVLALRMDWFVLNCPHLMLWFPCERCRQFTHNLGLVNALLALKMLTRSRKILAIPLAFRTFHILLPPTSERQRGICTHESLHLENKVFSQSCGVVSTLLSETPSLSLLWPQLVWFQGQDPAGSFKLHLPRMLFSFLPLISPSRETQHFCPHTFYSIAGSRPEFGSCFIALWLCDGEKNYLRSPSSSLRFPHLKQK